jgi:hypothetical protein
MQREIGREASAMHRAPSFSACPFADAQAQPPSAPGHRHESVDDTKIASQMVLRAGCCAQCGSPGNRPTRSRPATTMKTRLHFYLSVQRTRFRAPPRRKAAGVQQYAPNLLSRLSNRKLKRVFGNRPADSHCNSQRSLVHVAPLRQTGAMAPRRGLEPGTRELADPHVNCFQAYANVELFGGPRWSGALGCHAHFIARNAVTSSRRMTHSI